MAQSLLPAAAVNITVLAIFGRDTNSDGVYDEFVFTDNVPAGGEAVNLSGTVWSQFGASPVTIVQTFCHPDKWCSISGCYSQGSEDP